MPTDLIHLFLDIITPVVLGVLAYVTIMNRAERTKSALAILEAQSELKEDFNEKHEENKRELAVHISEDTGQFNLISNTLGRMERNLDKLANGK